MPTRSEGPSVLPIVLLVRREIARIGKPLRDIAGDGQVIKYGTLRRYQDEALRLEGPPRISTMRQLSRALGVDFDEVRAAFDASLFPDASGGRRLTATPSTPDAVPGAVVASLPMASLPAAAAELVRGMPTDRDRELAVELLRVQAQFAVAELAAERRRQEEEVEERGRRRIEQIIDQPVVQSRRKPS